MQETTNEQHIKRIIEMEAKINACRRCSSKHRCFSKPALGKGDLVPEMLLVFQAQGNQSPAINNCIIEIRQMLRMELQRDRIYHTFLVRCQPQACMHIDDLEDMMLKHTVYHNNNCHFNEPVCQGVSTIPAGSEVLACLPYLLEEIDILSPPIIILFGKRTAEFVLKAMGILKKPLIPGCYQNNNQCIFTTVEESHFTKEDAQRIAEFLAVR